MQPQVHAQPLPPGPSAACCSIVLHASYNFPNMITHSRAHIGDGLSRACSGNCAGVPSISDSHQDIHTPKFVHGIINRTRDVGRLEKEGYVDHALQSL